MNTSVMGLRVASVVFGLAGIAHLLRLLMELEVMIAGHRVPVWFSAPGFIVAGALCWWLWRLSLPAKTAENHSDAEASHLPPAATV